MTDDDDFSTKTDAHCDAILRALDLAHLCECDRKHGLAHLDVKEFAQMTEALTVVFAMFIGRLVPAWRYLSTIGSMNEPLHQAAAAGRHNQ
jgi:hypothetical protein